MPIVLSAVAVFIASSIIWMATPIHKADFKAPPDEAGLMAYLQQNPHAPGVYYVPWCQGQNMKDPAFLERFNRGPWALLTVMSGKPSMGRCLTLWMLNLLVVSILIGVAARWTIPHGPNSPSNQILFYGLAAIALLPYVGMAAQNTIWLGQSWRHAVVKVFDGVVYAAITAGIFLWLWPRTFVPLAG
ncbi:MAG: hypothetical protein KF745_03640 [Phycisphaeraceae bacterium]|nr:hypothetical protein [Phycisphaeraceae bacterium]